MRTITVFQISHWVWFSIRWNWPQQRATWTGICTSTWRCAAWREDWTCRWKRAVGWSKEAGTLRLSVRWPAATQGTQTRSKTRSWKRKPRLRSPLVDGCTAGLGPASSRTPLVFMGFKMRGGTTLLWACSRLWWLCSLIQSQRWCSSTVV